MADKVRNSTEPAVQDAQVNGVRVGNGASDIAPAQAEAPSAADPMAKILAAFQSIPTAYHADLFSDFRDAAASQDLRRLLDTISDWAATAELYADAPLAADLRDAIGGRKGVADWLPG